LRAPMNVGGWVSFRIPVGNWTFLAIAGEVYESSRPGFGYFVAFRGRVLEARPSC
jgi:hypothetical protein